MDIIRTLKLKEIAGEFDDLNEHERFILSILSKLSIQHINDDEFYLKINVDGRTLYIFHVDYRYKFVRCHNGYILYPLCQKFHLSTESANKVINDALKRLGFGDVTYADAEYHSELDIV